MTNVKELISKLEEMPQAAEVFLGDMHIDESPLDVQFDRVDNVVWLS